MSNMTRVNMQQLANALGGDTTVADALSNVMNGSAMNAYTPVVTGGSATGVWAQIGTLTYVEIILTATGPATVYCSFHASRVQQYGCGAAWLFGMPVYRSMPFARQVQQS
jgi:hypothetical protein